VHRRTAVTLSFAALGTGVALLMSASSGARAAEQQTRVIDQDVDLAGARALEVHAGSGNLDARSSAARRQPRPGENPAAARTASAHIHAELHGTPEELAAAGLHVAREGDRVVVTIDEPQRRGSWLWGNWSWHRAWTYEILVGADVDLMLRTGSGNVTVDTPQRELTVRTGSGNVTITDARGAVRANTGSGNVSLRTAASTVQLQTGSGNVVAGLGSGWRGEGVDIQTGSGNVRLAVPAGFHGAVQTHTGSGHVTGQSYVAAAASPVVSLRTGSGNVHIVPAGE
jgi:Putative adhesin